MHDSVLVERLEACDNCCAPAYHWIEEGTYEDFKRNILESDLPIITFGFASTGFASFPLMGTVTGRMASDTPNIQERERRVADICIDFETHTDGIPLMGTVAWQIGIDYAVGNQVAYQGQQWVIQDQAAVEQTVLAMLLARPEVVNNGR